MNLLGAKLQQNIITIHYIQKDEYMGKKLKSYTGKDVFIDTDSAIKFLNKNGYNQHEGLKYDMVSNAGSLTTYAILKENELYSY